MSVEAFSRLPAEHDELLDTTLKDSEQGVIRRLYGLSYLGVPQTRRDIAYDWRIGEDRVRQLEREGIKKLNATEAGRHLVELLPTMLADTQTEASSQ